MTDKPRAIWWFGDGPPEQIAGQVAAHDAVKAAEQVVADVADAEQHRADTRRWVAVRMLAETLLPALETDDLNRLLDRLDDRQRRDVTVLLHRAGWTVRDGRLHPPDR